MTDTPKNNKQTEASKADDPVADAIFALLDGGASPTFQEVARHFAEPRVTSKDRPDAWRKYLNAVKQQAIHLANTGRVEIVRKGEAVDPKGFKGIVRLRYPS